jgi:hypothetical protein
LRAAHLTFYACVGGSAGFQPAVSPTSSRQAPGSRKVCGLEIRDTAGWKPALQKLRFAPSEKNWTILVGSVKLIGNFYSFLSLHIFCDEAKHGSIND